MNTAAIAIIMDLLTAAPALVKTIEGDIAQYKSAPDSKARVDAVLAGITAILKTAGSVL